MFLDGGGLPPGALAPEPTAFLPNPNAPQRGGAAPVQEPTAFLPNPNAPGGVDPMADAEEGTAFVAPPSPHGPAHAPVSRPPSQVRPPSEVRVPSQVRPPSVAAPPPGRPAHPPAAALGAHEPSMTRFVVEERNMTKTVLMFVAGLVLALSAAGAAAYFILEPVEPPQASE
jgi:hypothetical protein